MRHEQVLRSFASLLTVEKCHDSARGRRRDRPNGDGGSNGSDEDATSTPPPPPDGENADRKKRKKKNAEPVGSSPMIRGFMLSYGCGHGATCAVPSLDTLPGPLPPRELERRHSGFSGRGFSGAGGTIGEEARQRRRRRKADNDHDDKDEDENVSLPTQLLRSFLQSGNPFPPPPSANKGKKKLQRRRRSAGKGGASAAAAAAAGEASAEGSFDRAAAGGEASEEASGRDWRPSATTAPAAAMQAEEVRRLWRQSVSGGGGFGDGRVDDDDDDDDDGVAEAPDLGPEKNMSAPLYYTTEPSSAKRSPCARVDVTDDVATAPHVVNANISRVVRLMLDGRMRRYLDKLVRKSVVEHEGFITDGASRVLGHDVSQRDVDFDEEDQQEHMGEPEPAPKLEDVLAEVLVIKPEDAEEDEEEKKEEGNSDCKPEDRMEEDGKGQRRKSYSDGGKSSFDGDKKKNQDRFLRDRSANSFRCFSGRPLRVPRNAGSTWLHRTQSSRVEMTNHRVPVSISSSVTSFNVPRGAAGTATKQRRTSMPMLQEQTSSASSSPKPMEVDFSEEHDKAPTPPSDGGGGSSVAAKSPVKDINPSEKTTCTTVITTVSLPITFAAIVTVELGGRGSGHKFDLEFGTSGQIVGSFRGPSSNPLLIGVDIDLDTHILYHSMLDQVMYAIKKSMMSVIRTTPSLQDQPSASVPPGAALNRRGSCASSVVGQSPRKTSMGMGPCRRVSMTSSRGGSGRSLMNSMDAGSPDDLIALSARLGEAATRCLGGEGACPKATQAAALLRRASMASCGSARSLMSNLDIHSRRGSMASVGSRRGSKVSTAGDAAAAAAAAAGGTSSRRGSMIGASLSIHGNGDATLQRLSMDHSVGGQSNFRRTSIDHSINGQSNFRRTSMDHSVNGHSNFRRTSMDHSVGGGGRAERRLSGITRPAPATAASASAATFTAANVEKRRRVSNEFERRRASMEHARRLSVLGGTGGSTSVLSVIQNPHGSAPVLPTTFAVLGGKNDGVAVDDGAAGWLDHQQQQQQQQTGEADQASAVPPPQAMDVMASGRRVSVVSTTPTGLGGVGTAADAAEGTTPEGLALLQEQQRRLSVAAVSSDAASGTVMARLMANPASRPSAARGTSVNGILGAASTVGGGEGMGAVPPAAVATGLLQPNDPLTEAGGCVSGTTTDAAANGVRRPSGGFGLANTTDATANQTSAAARKLSGGLGLAGVADAMAGPNTAAAVRRLSARLSGAGGSMASAAAAAQLQIQSELNQLENIEAQLAAAQMAQGGQQQQRRGSFQRRVSLDRELLGPILGDVTGTDVGQAVMVEQRRRLSLEAQDIARMEEMTRLGLL